MSSGKSSKKIKKPAAITDAPLFSVIVLTFQQRHLLEDCIDSILQQTYPNIELVICDDCSADFDEEEVRRYIDANKEDNIKNVIVYKQPFNVGTTENAQKGVELSSGKYFKLHAGDDMLYNETVLEKMAEKLRDKTVHLLAGRSIACQHDGTMTDHYYPSIQAVTEMINGDARRQFELMGTQSWGEYINAPAVFWKRSFFDEIGGFDLRYKYTEDWPMWLKITGAGYRITMIEELTTIYRYGGISNDASTMNLTLGKKHYEESIDALESYALKKFEAEGNRKKIMRCRQSIRCLKARIETEGEWDSWSGAEKMAWRFRNIRFLLVSWIYRKRMYGIDLPCQNLYTLLGVCLVMFALHVQVWPGIVLDQIWARGFMMLLLCVVLRKGTVKGINMLNGILNARRNHG